MNSKKNLSRSLILTLFCITGFQTAAETVFTPEPLAKFIDRVIFPPLEGASLSPSVKPEPA
jgi:hypothetical protein